MSDAPTILLTPGPVPLTENVKEQLGRSMTHHRSQEIRSFLRDIQINLKKIFQTKEPVYILHSTGTGAMEASIVNTLSPQDEVLTVSAGKFGERWLELAKTYRLKPYEIQIPWGQAVPANIIQEQLTKHPKVKAILIQACETSTGAVHPIKEISKITKNLPHVLLIVDSISALMAQNIPMDEWGIDVLIGGSQKSFSLPAGLSFIALSKKAQSFQEKSNLPKYYFDLKKESQANKKNETAFSSNVSFIRALKTSLDDFLKKGASTRYKKCQTRALALRQFCKIFNLNLFSSSSSSSVTAICVPGDGVKIKKIMEEKNIIVGGGQGQLKGKIIRFGHIGPIPDQDYLKGLEVFGNTLIETQPLLFKEETLKKALALAEKILKQTN